MRRLTQGTERGGRGALRVTALLTLLSALLVVPAAASAADFNPAAGSYTADTTTLKITGPGPTNITGANVGGVAVFSFEDVNIASGVTITATGSRPLKIVASGNLTLAGFINASGAAPDDSQPGPFAGGAGGGAGGTPLTKGAGPGGGGASASVLDGGAGGGFGGRGARGGKNGGGGAANAAGVAYGNLNGTLQGGSGGAGAANTGGGGGGGAVALFGNFVTISASGQVRADGGAGSLGGGGASGGGSGGGIVIHGDTVEVNGALVARGGDGGLGGCCGDGGGGGGGRIAYQYRTLVSSGSTFVTGGTSGVRQTGGCCVHGTGSSPDATGAAGVVTKTQAASSNTGPATGVSSNAATLNGTINPHLSATKFHFDFGTTTGYGSRVPATDATVGSDNADHGVSLAVGGLAPSTTYHYRLVAVDALGFVTPGADVGFTTAAAPPPPPTGGGGGGGGVLPPPPALTAVPSTASINSLGFKKYTKLLNLSAKNLPGGATVVVTCKTKKKSQQKKGCPYKSKRFTTSGGRASLNLRKPFRTRKVPVGAKITITITAPGFLGKRIQYTIRAAKIPKSSVRCLSAAGKAGSCA